MFVERKSMVHSLCSKVREKSEKREKREKREALEDLSDYMPLIHLGTQPWRLTAGCYVYG